MNIRCDLRIFHNEMDIDLVSRSVNLKPNYAGVSIFTETLSLDASQSRRYFNKRYHDKYCWLRMLTPNQQAVAGNQVNSNLAYWIGQLSSRKRNLRELVDKGYWIVIDCIVYADNQYFQIPMDNPLLRSLGDLGVDLDLNIDFVDGVKDA